MYKILTIILFIIITHPVNSQNHSQNPPGNDFKDYSGEKLPVTFTLQGTGRLGPVKTQPDGGCWSSAALGSVESVWRTFGFGEYILSDINLKLCNGFDPSRSTYGNHYMATAYFTRGSGPIMKNPETDSLCEQNPVKPGYITDARFLPDDPGLIKQTIVETGAVYSMLYFRKELLDTLTNIYYCPKKKDINHAIDLVGWNDTLKTESGKGVWIAQNSLGISFGDKGYFYIPYSDPNILKYNAIWPKWISYDPEAEIYYYDTLGSYRSYGFHDSVCYGLVKFTARDSLFITKIGTSVNEPNTKIFTEIYHQFDTVTMQLSEKLAVIGEATCKFAGYYTFDLNEKVRVKKDEDFYILTRYITPNDTMPIPIETFIRGYSDPKLASHKCWINPDYNKWPEAWYECGADSKFKFLNFNLCIKAYTLSADKK